jgi:hypothetical protein
MASIFAPRCSQRKMKRRTAELREARSAIVVFGRTNNSLCFFFAFVLLSLSAVNRHYSNDCSEPLTNDRKEKSS